MSMTPEELKAWEEDPERRASRIVTNTGCDPDKAKVALSLADEYAPDAPLDLRNEAAERTAGWLKDMSPALASESEIETYESGKSHTHTRQFRPSAANPLRASGGMAILAKYVVRRAV